MQRESTASKQQQQQVEESGTYKIANNHVTGDLISATRCIIADGSEHVSEVVSEGVYLRCTILHMEQQISR